MKLRGRYDIARTICIEKDIETTSPLASIVGDERLYCTYKLRLYTIELNRLLTTYHLTQLESVRKDIEYYLKCTESLCDLCIDRGVKVDDIYYLIEKCYEVL